MPRAPRDAGRRATGGNTRGSAAERAAVLTQREREVLAALARGHTLEQIGGALGIRAKTVERHKARIMAKLNIHNRATLVRFAIWIGLIPIWEEPDGP